MLKITDKRKQPEEVAFDTLNVGEVFTNSEYCGVWIKGDVDSEGDYTSICLDDGSLYYFSDDDLVSRVNTELLITD